MRINPKGTLFGQPALKIRNALKGLGDGAWKPIRWDKHLPDTGKHQRRKIERRMLRAGFIEQGPDPIRCDYPNHYTLTSRGLRLANASARSYKRTTAERALKQIVDRARAINAGDYAYSVECLVVFGSYLSGAPRVGDLDLAMSLVRRPHQDWNQFAARFRRRAPPGACWLTRLCWPEEEVVRFLKGRSQIVSLMYIGGQEEAITSGPYEVVFGKWEPPSRQVQ